MQVLQEATTCHPCTLERFILEAYAPKGLSYAQTHILPVPSLCGIVSQSLPRGNAYRPCPVRGGAPPELHSSHHSSGPTLAVAPVT